MEEKIKNKLEEYYKKAKKIPYSTKVYGEKEKGGILTAILSGSICFTGILAFLSFNAYIAISATVLNNFPPGLTDSERCFKLT